MGSTSQSLPAARLCCLQAAPLRHGSAPEQRLALARDQVETGQEFPRPRHQFLAIPVSWVSSTKALQFLKKS